MLLAAVTNEQTDDWKDKGPKSPSSVSNGSTCTRTASSKVYYHYCYNLYCYNLYPCIGENSNHQTAIMLILLIVLYCLPYGSRSSCKSLHREDENSLIITFPPL